LLTTRRQTNACLSLCHAHSHALQEEGNIPYVVDNGVGTFETDPAKIADIMAAWLAPSNKAAFRHMAHRSAALGRPQAVYEIVDDLDELTNTATSLCAA
jgi:1,2-diacylglycerol 3-beta-galactosyltransferase